jgi:hypothetical protein
MSIIFLTITSSGFIVLNYWKEWYLKFLHNKLDGNYEPSILKQLLKREKEKKKRIIDFGVDFGYCSVGCFV